MLSLFTTLKPFKNPHIATIQRNAIQSWLALKPKCEILLLGNDEGVKNVAREYHVRHIPEVETNKQGFPLIHSLFSEAQKRAEFPLLCYTNGDIIFMDDFLAAIKTILLTKKSFLAVGRRWDMEIKKPLSFTKGWQKKLLYSVRKEGVLHGSSGIDFFVFSKKTFPQIPDLVVGRAGWDNWMIFNARSRGIPVVDITPSVTVIHQNHDFPGKRETAARFKDKSAQNNIALAGGYKNLFTIRDADYTLVGKKLKKTLSRYFSFFYPLRLLLSLKRALIKRYAA